MEIKFKKLTEKAVAPSKSYATDAGFDLTCAAITTVRNACNQVMLVYHSGIAVEIPEGYVGLLFPRSSVYQTSLIPSNCVGVIDADYRGEVMMVMRNTTDVIPALYKEGERFAQLVIMKLPEAEFIEAEELSETERSVKGFGSTNVTENTNPNGSQTENMDSAEKAIDLPNEASQESSVEEPVADQSSNAQAAA